MRHYVTYNQGEQVLYHVPKDLHARPARASATFEIVNLTDHEDSPDRTVAPTAAATQDTFSANLVGCAGPGNPDPRRIQLDDPTGLQVGHDYLLEGTDGRTELVRVNHIDSIGGDVYVRRNIRHEFADTSQLRGVELAAPFPASAANDGLELEDGGGPYGLIWTYTIDSRTYHAIDDVYVRRYTSQTFCDVADVIQAYPMFSGRNRDRAIEDAIAFSSKKINAELENAGSKPELIHTLSLNVAATHLAIAIALRTIRVDGGDSDIDDIEHHEQQHRYLMRSILNGQPPARTTDIDHQTGEARRGGRRSSFNELIKPG